MNGTKRLFGALTVIAVIWTQGAWGQGSMGSTAPAAPPAKSTTTQGSKAAPATGQAADFQRSLQLAADEMLELAGAIPQEKYTWRPGEGVRSVAEVYLHVAEGNYSIPMLVGVKPPKDVDLKAFDSKTTDKAAVIQTLTASFAHARAAIASVPASEWETKVDIWGHAGTKREALLELVSHAHEHLGQSIAYARMNGVVPPWTAREQAPPAAPAGSSR